MRGRRGGRRLAIYCDYPYRVHQGRISAEQPVALFLAQMAVHCESLSFIGRLDRDGADYPYAVGNARLVALPHYASGAALSGLLHALPVSLRRFWRMLDSVDVVWVFGPNLMSPIFAALTLLRGRRLVLGVRQDLPALFAHRYPQRPLLRGAAGILEASFRSLGRLAPVTTVGPQLARNYRHSRAVHEMYVSLLRTADVDRDVDARDYDAGVLRMLSVGRLDPEKNPLLLADVLDGALRRDPRWRLDVCGDGPLMSALRARLAELGVADRAILHGHVPVDGGLLELYRAAHAFIHVSHSEGVPQVLLEAFATRLPLVATAVGGVPEMVGDAGLLIGPDDADAAVTSLQRIVDEPETRERIVSLGVQQARRLTLEAEAQRAAAFVLDETTGGP